MGPFPIFVAQLVLALGPFPIAVCCLLCSHFQGSLAGFDRLCVGFALVLGFAFNFQLRLYLRSEFGFGSLSLLGLRFSFRLRLQLSASPFSLAPFRFPQVRLSIRFAHMGMPFRLRQNIITTLKSKKYKLVRSAWGWWA